MISCNDVEVWDLDSRDVVEDLDSVANGDDHVQDLEDSSLRKTIRWVMLFIFLWASFYGVSANAVGHLIKFFHTLLDSLSHYSAFIASLAALFPPSIYLAKKYLKLDKENFSRFVVCAGCHTLYHFRDCYERVGSQHVAKVCSHVPFPNHPHASRRKACGHKLVKEIKCKDGSVRLYPLKTYCFKSTKEILECMMKRKGFLDLCELWRKRTMPDGYLADVYDGRVWKKFLNVNGRDFLNVPYNLAFMLNIDWFEPFQHSPYSVGVIYLALLNLPRSLRFKWENIFVVGIIPGPKEPSTNINSYLSPLVNDLLELWERGMIVDTSAGDKIKIHAALLCVACDVPAARKTCGFLSHSAGFGCSKCTKLFPYDNVKKRLNFSGFTPCPPRSHNQHVFNALQNMKASTRTEREVKEKRTGSRYSELMRLPYFDCVQFTIIDPMHNLFLGTAKHVLKNIWLNDDDVKISGKHFQNIQNIVDSCAVPKSLGRIPHKIASSFSSFTADQWKNWTLVFSLLCLNGILPTAELECWRLFVQACHCLCTPLIKECDARAAHSLLLQFCQSLETVYGEFAVTPNMHLHTHLLDCILDYGPVYSFWLFSFERFNGILGSYHTNQRAIEIQVMRKFLLDFTLKELVSSEEWDASQLSLFGDLYERKQVGSVKEVMPQSDSLLELSQQPIRPSLDYFYLAGIVCLPPHTVQMFDFDSLRYLRQAYYAFVPNIDITEVPSIYECCKEIDLFGERLGSERSRLNRSCHVKASWHAYGGAINTTSHPSCPHPGVVKFFFKQRIRIGSSFHNMVMACVRWLQPHPQHSYYGTPLEVWSHNLFEPDGPASFMPVQRIESQFVSCKMELNNMMENVSVVCPLPRKIHL